MSEKTEAKKAEPKSLVSKLSEVMGAVDWVAKDGLNKAQGYNYATEAGIVAAVRKEMASRQLLMVPGIKSVEWSTFKTAAGAEWRLCTMVVTFTIHDGETGATLAFDIIGQGADNGDKASYKAMTGATKYALLKLFLIPTGTDPEDEPAAKAAPPPAGVAALKHAATAPKPTEEPPPHGEEDAPAASHDRTLTFKFGKDKGTPLAKLSDDSVSWYRSCIQRDIADPTKAQWARIATLQLATVDAELRLRGLPVGA